MLVHVTQTHTWETCMAHDPKRNAALRKAVASAKVAGVKVIGMYANAPAHRLYWLLEADSADQIAKFFDPILELGQIETEPVTAATGYLKD
jgi:uncharacterized protein with GYD domain